MAEGYKTVGGLSIHPDIHALVAGEIAPDSGQAPEAIFAAVETLVKEFGAKNREFLQKRDDFQKQIDGYFRDKKSTEPKAFAQFLEEIGYIRPEGEDFTVATKKVDPELSSICGPQLVVPVDNARFALNAANARWGSLYDALYGAPGNINIIEDGEDFARPGYNPDRGDKVIRRAAKWLDETIGLEGGSFSEVIGFDTQGGLTARLFSGKTATLKNPALYAGWRRNGSVLFRHNGLHIELSMSDRGIRDVLLEAAVTTIQDLEDSVAAVDGADKAGCYRNWHGLMTGNLSEAFEKNGKPLTRTLSADREYISPDGRPFTLPGRSLMFTRNVGMQMYTNAVMHQGKEIPEAFLDLILTVVSASCDVKKASDHPRRNSRLGSIYIVKPKMHGPDEVAFNVALFARAEELLGLPAGTLKIGIMDEEQRTSLNLKECIRAAKDRVVFINTGFLDRTGDFIHTFLKAGACGTKKELNEGGWLQAYEWNNTLIGLALKVHEHGQIGKGMWAQNVNMKGLYETKKNHPEMGASTAWVPSPTGATIHALHYHAIDVKAKQRELASRPRPDKSEIVAFPLFKSATDVVNCLESYAQSVLGYVVRWVDMGIGCSSVPDINDVRLMEDRATLRIHSQILASWLTHGVINPKTLEGAFVKVSAKIDGQNKGVAGYVNLVGNQGGASFRCAMALVMEGAASPNGYVDDILKQYRLEAKAGLARQKRA